MTHSKREEGFTLIELVISASLMIVVLLATFSVFDVSVRADSRNQHRNDAQAAARTTTDRLARELRNVATPGQPTALERANATDLVFDMVDPSGPSGGSLNPSSVLRVRYCLDTSVPTNERVWRQVQTWTSSTRPALSSASACPDLSWTQPPTIVVDHVTNSPAQPVFAFNGSVLTDITQVITNLFIDYRPVNSPSPGPSELRTSVTIRSTAQPPAAAFTATAVGNRQVLLNGGASTDPDGRTLKYYWYYDGGSNPIGTSAILNYVAPATGVHSFTLKVTNTAGLSSTTTQAVTVT